MTSIYSTWIGFFRSQLGFTYATKKNHPNFAIQKDINEFKLALQLGRKAINHVIAHWFCNYLQHAWKQQQEELCSKYGKCLAGDHTYKVVKKLQAFDPKLKKKVSLLGF